MHICIKQGEMKRVGVVGLWKLAGAVTIDGRDATHTS